MDIRLYKLQQKQDRVQAKLNRMNGVRPDETARVAQSFHLGMVGGSGPNTARLNRIRERSIERTVANAVEYFRLTEELAWIKASIRAIETEPARQVAKARAEEMLSQNGKTACGGVKAGDMVRWIVSGTTVKVIRVNRSSVTVEMCGGVERLKFSEVTAA